MIDLRPHHRRQQLALWVRLAIGALVIALPAAMQLSQAGVWR